MMNKQLRLAMFDFKAIGTGMEFSCYTNVKGNVDHAMDRTLDGAYTNSIAKHEADGTMPKMFWNHDSYSPPIGTWLEMAEDDTGLFKRGRMLDSDRGVEIYKGLKAGAIDSFSIGYRVIKEQWNSVKGCNDLIELDIKESSPVNFACNEMARIVDVKNRLHKGEMLSKADLRVLLDSTHGLSKRQIERITCNYNPTDDVDPDEVKALFVNSTLFS